MLLRDPAVGTPDRALEAARLRGHIGVLNRVAKAAISANASLGNAAATSLANVDAIAAIFSEIAENFSMAYESHARTLAAAKQAVAEAGAIRDAILGVAIGVGAAFKIVPLIEAMTTRKLLIETGGELAELTISKTIDAASPGEQADPPSLSPEAKKLAQARELVELYRDLTVIRTGTDPAPIAFDCKDVIIEIERYDEGGGRSAAYIDQRVEALGPKEVLATALESKAASFQQEISALFHEAQARLAVNGPRDLLEDIWTYWLAEGGNPWLVAGELLDLGILSEATEFADLGYVKDDMSGESSGDAALALRLRAMRGKKGVASSALAPTGTVEIDGQLWRAQGAGDDIAAGTAIRVTSILRPDERRAGHQEWHYQTSITLIVVAEESL